MPLYLAWAMAAKPAVWERPGHFQPHVVAVYLARLRALGLDLPEAAGRGPIRRYNGDRLEAGRGEILVATG